MRRVHAARLAAPPGEASQLIHLYDELMLAPYGLTKLERGMIAVAMSAWNRCY